MSHPQKPESVKLIASLFSADRQRIDMVINLLEDAFGTLDWISPEFFFDKTKYYAAEMGWPLHRRFVSFRGLIQPTQLVDIKLKTHAIEQEHLSDGKRTINIDPGYISPERLILATGKNFTHRVYLDRGIYADLTLIFQKGTFRPLEWTYPDYAGADVIALFNEIRKRYMRQLSERS
jgi:hypothetical protein